MTNVSCTLLLRGARAEVLCFQEVVTSLKSFSIPNAPFVGGDEADHFTLASTGCSFQKGLFIEMPTLSSTDHIRPTISICIFDTNILGSDTHALHIAGDVAAANYALHLSIRNSHIATSKAAGNYHNVYGLTFGNFIVAASVISILHSTIAAVSFSGSAETSSIFFDGTKLLSSSFSVIDSNLTATVSGPNGYCLRWAKGAASDSNVTFTGASCVVEGNAVITAFLHVFQGSFAGSTIGIYGSSTRVMAQGAANAIAAAAFIDASSLAEGSVVEFVGTSLNITTLSTYGSAITAAALYLRSCRLGNGTVFRLSDVPALLWKRTAMTTRRRWFS